MHIRPLICHDANLAARPVEGHGIAVCIYFNIECRLETGSWVLVANENASPIGVLTRKFR